MKYLTTIIVAAALAVIPASASANGVHHCRPFKGPYDNIVHSKGFRVTGIGCAKAKRVILYGVHRGNPRQFHYHHRYWTTHKTGGYPPLGYKQVWISGHRKRIWLTWID